MEMSLPRSPWHRCCFIALKLFFFFNAFIVRIKGQTLDQLCFMKGSKLAVERQQSSWRWSCGDAAAVCSQLFSGLCTSGFGSGWDLSFYRISARYPASQISADGSLSLKCPWEKLEDRRCCVASS